MVKFFSLFLSNTVSKNHLTSVWKKVGVGFTACRLLLEYLRPKSVFFRVIICFQVTDDNNNFKQLFIQVTILNTNHHHHHHHIVLLARISLTLPRHFSLSFIASGRSSGLHPVPSHSCCMYVRAGCPAFAWLYVGVHRSTSLMSSSLLLQQCPACLVRLT